MILSAFQSIPQMVRDWFSDTRTTRASTLHHLRDQCPESYEPFRFLDDWRSLSIALRELGVGQDKSVGIMCPSSPQWILCDLAIQVCKARVVPCFSNLAVDTFCFQRDDASMDAIFLDDPAQLPEPLRAEALKIPLVICWRNAHDIPRSLLLSDLIAQGRLLRKNQGDAWFDRQVDSLGRDDIATMIYTSGSTGTPKGALISHGNLLFQLESAAKLYDLHPDRDRALSILPVAHIFERMCVYFYISRGIDIWFGADPKAVGEYLRGVRPTVMTLVPRILERLYERLVGAAQQARGPRRLILNGAIRHARRADPFRKGWISCVWDILVYRKMRAALGDSLKLIISGSSALNPSVHRFLLNIGLPIYEGYGLTECSPTLAACYPGHLKIGSVGPAFPGVLLRIGENQEIQARSPGIMRGYHNNPQATQAMFTPDGWLKTGDSGYLDEDGFLYITGRIKELFKSSTGKYISPLPIEMALTRDPLIESAVIIADNRKFVSALIFLNHALCQSLLGHTQDYLPQRAIASRRVNERIRRRVTLVNQNLNEWEKIRRWVILPDVLTPDSGLLTPTLKIRRKQIESHFHGLIESLYAENA